jgi:dihydropteroate synthase
LPGSLAAEVFATIKGADIIRTHNVRETRNVVSIAMKLLRIHKSL